MSFITDFFASLSADVVSGAFLKKTGMNIAAGAVGNAGKSIGDGLVRGLAGSADTVGIIARRALQSDEGAKDALNRCIVRVPERETRLKLARFFKTLDDATFARIARNIDDLFADSLDNEGNSQAYKEDDPRIIFLKDFASLDEGEMLPYLEALRYDEEPTARTKFKVAMSRLKTHNNHFAYRHNLKE